jgi:hypothetical protein
MKWPNHNQLSPTKVSKSIFFKTLLTPVDVAVDTNTSYDGLAMDQNMTDGCWDQHSTGSTDETEFSKEKMDFSVNVQTTMTVIGKINYKVRARSAQRVMI